MDNLNFSFLVDWAIKNNVIFHDELAERFVFYQATPDKRTHKRIQTYTVERLIYVINQRSGGTWITEFF